MMSRKNARGRLEETAVNKLHVMLPKKRRVPAARDQALQGQESDSTEEAANGTKLSFSRIKTKEALVGAFKKLPISVNYVSSLDDEFSLPADAEDAICSRIAPGLAYATSFIRANNEKSRYFFVYEVLKEFIRIGHGYEATVQLDIIDEGGIAGADIADSDGVVASDEDAVDSDSVAVGDAVDSDDNQRSSLCGQGKLSSALFFEHEPTIGGDGIPKGPIEFVVFDGPGENAMIRAIVEVKRELPKLNEVPIASFQLCAELISSIHHNFKLDPNYPGFVWGALTTGFEWYFFKAKRDSENIGYTVEIGLKLHSLFGPSSPSFPDSARESSLLCMSRIFHGLFPDLKPISGTTISACCSKIDDVMNEEAKAFLVSAKQSKASSDKQARAIVEAALAKADQLEKDIRVVEERKKAVEAALEVALKEIARLSFAPVDREKESV